MYDMFEYLVWRGDLPFSRVAPNPVDLLIFSTLSYISYDGIVPETPNERISLREAAEKFFAQADLEDKVRVKKDLRLLEEVACTERFSEVDMSFYRNIFDPEAETQFAAVTFHLGDGTAVLAFRGTDRTLVGWKEDFNMSFQDTVPAQREALRYLNDFVISSLLPMRLVGHSKGGNLAVYAAAKADPFTKQRIIEIHNQDGPGFSEHMMTDPGYLEVIPKIFTYVPESSVVGMLLEHEEPYMVIKSKQIGPMQHDPYSWEVLRNDFIYRENITESSRQLDRTLKTWFHSMTMEERNTLVDEIYEILISGGASKTDDLMQPKFVRNYLKTLATDEKKRTNIGSRMADLIQASIETQQNARK